MYLKPKQKTGQAYIIFSCERVGPWQVFVRGPDQWGQTIPYTRDKIELTGKKGQAWTVYLWNRKYLRLVNSSGFTD